MLTHTLKPFLLIPLAAILTFSAPTPYHKGMSALQTTYASYNQEWFGNSLPVNAIVKWSYTLPRDTMGECEFDGNRYTIRINARLRPFNSGWRLTLLHEMAHIVTFNEELEHGPLWLSEMKSLATRGAFDTLW